MMPSPAISIDSSLIEMLDVTIASDSEPELSLLAHVNWKVMPGEFWCVGGLHRTGKSDLLHVAAGLVDPIAGTRLLFGSPGLPREHEARRQIGMVFDGGQLFQDLTVAENLTLPLRYHANLQTEDALRQIGDLLELTCLTPFLDKLPASLGRNWQQRVGLARALTLKPSLLLLDNPLSGLDPRDVSWWLELLSQLFAGKSALSDKKMTLIATGDSLEPWRATAQQFAILKNQKFLPINSQEGELPNDNDLFGENTP